MKKKILICDDEQEIIELLKLYLEDENYEIVEANDGLQALSILKNQNIDLALIDVMMPKLNGLDLIHLIKNEVSIPLLIISARVSLDHRLLGYKIGAHDYITKPFEPLEVVAKVHSRLEENKPSSLISLEGLTLDTDRCTIESPHGIFSLTKVELAVLKLFMKSPNKVFTKAQIYRQGWEEEYLKDDNSLRVIINRVREKIGSEKIETIRGLGYRLKI